MSKEEKLSNLIQEMQDIMNDTEDSDDHRHVGKILIEKDSIDSDTIHMYTHSGIYITSIHADFLEDFFGSENVDSILGALESISPHDENSTILKIYMDIE